MHRCRVILLALCLALAWTGRALAQWTETQTFAGAQLATFTSATLAASVSYLLVYPPGYTAGGSQRYPVLYWLHGGGQNQSSGGVIAMSLREAMRPAPTEASSRSTATGRAASNSRTAASSRTMTQLPPFFIILPNDGPQNNSMWVNWSDGSYPTETVMTELITHVDATYRTKTTRTDRAFEGFSVGGRGAFSICFRNATLCAAASGLGSAVNDWTFFTDACYTPGPAIASNVFQNVEANFTASWPYALAGSATSTFTLRVLVGADDTGGCGTNVNTLPYNRIYAARLMALNRLSSTDFRVVTGAGHNQNQIYQGAETANYAVDWWNRVFVNP